MILCQNYFILFFTAPTSTTNITQVTKLRKINQTTE